MAQTNGNGNGKPLRAAGYCRTSGEGQRDNTSIGNQQHNVTGHCDREGWTFTRWYVDECKTGSKIAGRDSFREMLADAAAGKFDVIVVADIDRLARDGFDILSTSKTLKREFSVDTLDCKGKFDTRDLRRGLVNFLSAGIAEDERLRIMERTIMGRIRTAQRGEPWSGKNAWPVGRAWDKEKEQWYVTDHGRAIAAMLKRYLDGEGTTELGKQMGVKASKICQWIRGGQLGGEYKAKFHCPDIGIDQEVVVPGMPEVVPAHMIEQAIARLVFNRTNNRTDVQKYMLTGFLRCGVCGKALTGRDTHHAKRTYYHAQGGPCGFHTVPGEALEAWILDYLYGVFLDKPAFDRAVEAAAPSAKDRKALTQERHALERQLADNEKQINRLADAVSQGMDLSLLLDKQDSLKAERDRLAGRLEELDTKMAALPDPEMTKRAATVTRLRLFQQYKGRDWRNLSFDDVRQFLLHLFGPTTLASGTGIFATKDDKGKVKITFKGQVDFQALLVNGRPFTKEFLAAVDRWNRYADEHARNAQKPRQTRPERADGVNLVTSDLSARKMQVRVTLSVCSSSPPT